MERRVACYWLPNDVVFVAFATNGVVYNPLWPVYSVGKEESAFVQAFKTALAAACFDPNTRSVLPQPLFRWAEGRGFSPPSSVLKGARGAAARVADKHTAITRYRDRTTWDPCEEIGDTDPDVVGRRLWDILRSGDRK